MLQIITILKQKSFRIPWENELNIPCEFLKMIIVKEKFDLQK